MDSATPSPHLLLKKLLNLRKSHDPPWPRYSGYVPIHAPPWLRHCAGSVPFQWSMCSAISPVCVWLCAGVSVTMWMEWPLTYVDSWLAASPWLVYWSSSMVKVIGQSLRSYEENVPFPGMVTCTTWRNTFGYSIQHILRCYIRMSENISHSTIA